MSAVFLVIKDKKQIAKAAISGSPFIIGRSPQCDLPLDEALASRQHVEVVAEKGAYWVQDRGSRNGTTLNGEKIADRRKLKDGDEIGVGSTRLKFVLDPGGADAGDHDEDATRLASSIGPVESAPGQKVQMKETKGALDVKLRVVDGPLHGGVFKNWAGPLGIGRGLENHVVLLDDAVSSSHARIVQEGEKYFIEDLKSSNGTFLDGIKVQRSQLANGQKIKIGVSTLIFECVDLRKKRRDLKIALIGTASVLVIAALIKVLQPPDVAGQHIAVARNYEAQGNFAKALDEFGVALKVEPDREEAKRGLAQVKSEIAARDALSMAEKEAAAENYDKAKELCYRVLRDFPSMPGAVELDAVIKSIENARIAFAARNWSDARQLLETAQQTYPKSELIHTRLEQARSEQIAEQNLSQAKDSVQGAQLDAAQALLDAIPAGSVYAAEAKGLGDQISKDRRVADYLARARTSYAGGDLSGALAAIAGGLQQASDSASLLTLQDRIQKMQALAKPLADAEVPGQPDDVDALLQCRKACADVLALEPDVANSLHRRAADAQARIDAKLAQASQSNAAKAAEALQAGNRVLALQLFDVALKANSSDPDLTTQREKLYQQIAADCRKLYQEGIVHLDLGQLDLARDAFKQVLAIGIPGDEYYRKAASKLKGMDQ